MCLQPKTWNLIGKPPYRSLISPKNNLINGKISLLWMASNGLKPPIFKFSRLELQKLLNPCWPSETESQLRWVICWKNFVRIATHSESHLWNMAKSTRKSEFHSCVVFLTRVLQSREMDVMLNANFALSSNNKDELTDLYNYLIPKVITVINS